MCDTGPLSIFNQHQLSGKMQSFCILATLIKSFSCFLRGLYHEANSQPNKRNPATIIIMVPSASFCNHRPIKFPRHHAHACGAVPPSMSYQTLIFSAFPCDCLVLESNFHVYACSVTKTLFSTDLLQSLPLGTAQRPAGLILKFMPWFFRELYV